MFHRGASLNLNGFPADARRSAEAAIAKRDPVRRAAAERRSQRAAELVADADTRLRRLLGGDYDELRELMRRERLAVAGLLQPPQGLRTTPGLVHIARKRVVDGFLVERRIDRAELGAIGQDYCQAVAELTSVPDANVTAGFHLASNLDAWVGLSPHHQRALPWGVTSPTGLDDPHRWEVFQPPFFGFNFGFTQVHDNNFVVDRIHTLNPSVGDVGIAITMDADGTDNFDHAFGDGFSVVAVSFVPPVAGLVEVLIDAQCVEPTHRLRTHDEFGFSHSVTTQDNFLMLDVLHPNVAEPSYASMSTFQVVTANDSNHEQENLTRGQHYFAQLFSAGPVPAGESVVVCAGTRSRDDTSADDVSIHSASDFRWFISSVEVRIAP